MNDPELTPRTPADSVSVVSELMMPHQVNNLGHVFGGVVLSMVDRAAAVAAMRHSGQPSVTVSIDRVDFKEPIHAGELVTCTAQVNFVGRTSMEIGVRATAETLPCGVGHQKARGQLSRVASGGDHRRGRVTPLDASDPEDGRRYREGQGRREVREQLDRELEAER